MYQVETINGKYNPVNIIPKDNSIIVDNSEYNTIMLSATGNENGSVFSINKCMTDVQIIPGNNIAITSDTSTNEITIDSVGGGSVDSVNGNIGDVVIEIQDIQNLQDDIDSAKFDGHLNTDLVVSGSAYIQGSELGVDGQTTFQRQVDFNDQVFVMRDVTIEGDLTSNSETNLNILNVVNNANLSSNLTTDGTSF
jgi:hypothetical protein